MKVFLGEDRNCGLNYQLYQLHKYLSIYGYLTEYIDEADIIVLPGTCTCTEKMINRTLEYINDVYQNHKNAKIYVTGCVTREFKNDKINKVLKNFLMIEISKCFLI